jgi:hypothetical protein
LEGPEILLLGPEALVADSVMVMVDLGFSDEADALVIDTAMVELGVSEEAEALSVRDPWRVELDVSNAIEDVRVATGLPKHEFRASSLTSP